MVTKKKPTKKKEVDFFVWLRSGLRKLSQRWPPVYESLALAKEPYVGDNARRKFSYRCACCQQLFDAKSVRADHIIPAGTLSSYEDIAGFVERLYCPASGLQCLCSDCHDAKSLMERNPGMTLEEAFLQKEVIRLLKPANKKEMLDLFARFNYNTQSTSNPAKRKKALTEILTKERL